MLDTIKGWMRDRSAIVDVKRPRYDAVAAAPADPLAPRLAPAAAPELAAVVARLHGGDGASARAALPVNRRGAEAAPAPAPARFSARFDDDVEVARGGGEGEGEGEGGGSNASVRREGRRCFTGTIVPLDMQKRTKPSPSCRLAGRDAQASLSGGGSLKTISSGGWHLAVWLMIRKQKAPYLGAARVHRPFA